MSEEDIRLMEPEDLKQFITECVLRAQALKDAKKLYMKSFNEIVKKIDIEQHLAMDVLEGKDSELARKILIEVQSTLEHK